MNIINSMIAAGVLLVSPLGALAQNTSKPNVVADLGQLYTLKAIERIASDLDQSVQDAQSNKISKDQFLQNYRNGVCALDYYLDSGIEFGARTPFAKSDFIKEIQDIAIKHKDMIQDEKAECSKLGDQFYKVVKSYAVP